MTEKRIYNRTIFLGVGIALLFLLLIGRLFWIQSVEASKLHEKAYSVWNKSSPLEPKRGTIYDRNGKELANNAPAYTVAANPNQIDDPANAAKEIAPLLSADVGKLIELFSKKDKVHVEVRPEGWKVSKEIADKIEALELAGVFLVPESKRYYPNEYLAAHITGYVNKDGIAVSGLESYYDDILLGTPGSLAYMRYAQGNELPEGKRYVQPAKHGQNLI
ncbi:MAG: stage V sporulation protein D, partial [Bacilli bacterium]